MSTVSLVRGIFSLSAAAAIAFTPAKADTTRVRLELAAIDQTADPATGLQSDFDVYHLVAVDPVAGANTVRLSIDGVPLVAAQPSEANEPVRPTPELASFRGMVIPHSFIVGGDSSSASFVLDVGRGDFRFQALAAGFGTTLYEASNQRADGSTVVAVLTTPAGLATPSLTTTLGELATPVYGSPPLGRLPADLNSSGEVNLIDLSIFGAEYPDSDLLDLNDDGRVDLLDVSVFAASLGSEDVIDATSSGLVFTPGFFPANTFDLIDLGRLGRNFGSEAATIAQMDLNADRKVDLVDLNLLGKGFLRPPLSSSVIPEPTSTALICFGLLPLVLSRRQTSN